MREKETSEGRETADGEGRRTRRHDSRRRERVLDAALDVFAEDGVAGITHRKVAARADVPLGSVTYHFASLTDLCTRAFARYVERFADSGRGESRSLRRSFHDRHSTGTLWRY